MEGPIVLKGILEPEDAKLAASVGAQGIVVSNHGGEAARDGVEPPPPMRCRVSPRRWESRMTVLVDGGIRYGSDIIKARALGADGVLVGRPWAWALAAGGQPAVSRMLQACSTRSSATPSRSWA